MRYLLFLTFSLLITSCEKPPVTSSVEAAPDTSLELFETNVGTVKAIFEAFISKDMNKMRSFVADDFIWSPPGYGMDSIPIPQWEEAMKGFMANYNDIKYEDPLYYAGLGDDQKPDGGVRTYGNWRSIYVPNGKESAMKYYSVFQFNDAGKVEHQMEWYDSADLIPED